MTKAHTSDTSVTERLAANLTPTEPLQSRRKSSLSLSISCLGLSTRATTLLDRHNIHNLETLVSYTANELLIINGFGPDTVNQITEALQSRSLSLKIQQLDSSAKNHPSSFDYSNWGDFYFAANYK